MKKLGFVLLLMVILSAGAFAQHPEGQWGLGIKYQHHLDWDGFGGSWGGAFTLKAPQLPIFWGLNLRIENNLFGLTATGDYYFLNNRLLDEANFGWYLGFGAYAGFWHSSWKALDQSYSWNAIHLGGRVPVGVYFFPIEFFEVFFGVIPSVGLSMYFGDFDDNFRFPDGNLGFEIGFRFWF